MDDPRAGAPVRKSTLLLLTLLAGGVGAHRAYLGKLWQATASALLAITLIPGLLAVYDLIRFVLQDEAALQRLYPRAAPRRVWVSFLAGAIAFQALVGTAIWAYLVMNAEKGFRMRSGLIKTQDVTADLARRITDEFLTVGPADMSCDVSVRCRFGEMPGCRSIACMAPMYNDELQRGVIEDQLQSDWYPVTESMNVERTGAITLTFASEFLGPYFARVGRQLTLVPRLGGVEADLSAPSGAGRRDITWECARDSRTTLSPRLLELFCGHFSTLAGHKVN